ncbi:Reductases with broad range of substrate specificities [Phaffia rhodozyma]|uniref:Reductases with broad range of substrate specificities n=1 Tax=Phaffia rhodozyma TaxID=264483 RepID=A0A0F7SFW9_PHARH|nr:Reductases with broad range of substrate specificities [Phaffia rhodozyma]
MSSVLESAKEAIVGATGSQEAKQSTGAFPGPEAYGAETQKGRVAGIQRDMEHVTPEHTRLEGANGLVDYVPAGKLVGKKAIVTGGDSGIGRSVAEMYALEGADVAIVYLPEEQADADDVKAKVQAAGRQFIGIPTDQRSKANCQQIVDTVVKAWGQIDILVLNASVMYAVPEIKDITEEQFDRTLKTNLYGTFFLSQAAIPHMPKGSSIIITTSQCAFHAPPMLLDYSITKAGQVGLIKALAQQTLSKGIRVNGVAPGPVWTPLQPAAMDKDQMAEWHQSPAPIGRVGQPSELGGAYVFLASKEASFISGETINVNGGTVI